MGRYDDAQISEAHRRALDARLEVLRSRPELRKPELAKAVRAAFGTRDCGELKSEADHLFQVAREAFESGDPDEGDTWFSLASDALDSYHDCLRHDSLAPDEFLFE